MFLVNYHKFSFIYVYICIYMLLILVINMLFKIIDDQRLVDMHEVPEGHLSRQASVVRKSVGQLE